MKTFEQLKEQTTPEIIKKMVELAEGFQLSDDKIVHIFYFGGIDFCDIKDFMEWNWFSPLLHRAVEGWNKEGEPILIANNKIVHPSKVYPFSNYQPCHLTACEMAIWECLLEVLK